MCHVEQENYPYYANKARVHTGEALKPSQAYCIGIPYHIDESTINQESSEELKINNDCLVSNIIPVYKVRPYLEEA